MSGSLNRVTLIGNLGNDPEVRHTKTGQRIVTLSIATSERTEWHRVTIFSDGLGKNAEKYLRKGAKVLVEGKLSTRKWQDQEGNDRYATEVVLSPYNGQLIFLDNRRNANGATGEPDGGEPPAASGPNLDDEVPY